jgi:hypothetical protein
MDPERRDLLKAGSLMLVSLAALTRAAHSHAQAKGLPHVAENDAQATALGYREDAKKVDRAKFANYKPGTDCDDCIHYKGKKKEAYGPCDIFPGKSVSVHGWCTAFQPKK